MSAIEESTTGTIIEGTAALRLAENGASTSSATATLVGNDDAAEARSDASNSQQSSSQKAASTVGSSTDPNTTKVYYHIDDEPMPYSTVIPVAPDRVTLGDFKRGLNRSNFKYYCKAIDQEVGGEVKMEIRDDSHRLQKSSNGRFELFLLTADGSSHSDGTSTAFSKPVRHMVPGPAPSSLYPVPHSSYRSHYGQHYDRGNRRRFEESTTYTESDGRIFSDDESRVSTSTDNITSVSRQHHNIYARRRRNRRYRREPSRASSVSSMTETSMALEVITVTLNMDTVNFLGISIVGQSCSRGDNGIYVANVMPGGAVALDGRIEPGDMILQVNEVSFENFSNDQAVEVLKDAVNKRGPIKLTVAKSFDAGRTNYFAPSREPVRPIDTHAWVQHINAVRGMTMNAIPEGSEGAPTPIPGQYPPNYGGRPASSSTATSNGSGGQNTVVGPGGVFISFPKRLDIHQDKKKVVQAMALPNSGLDIRNRTWLKIPIPMSFLGSALIDWLMEHVDGLPDRKAARKYASELLKEKLIAHVVNKITFTEQCYYVFGDECADFIRLRMAAHDDSNGGGMHALSNGPQMPPPPPPPGGVYPGQWLPPHSSVGDYVAVPISPFPQQYVLPSTLQQQQRMGAPDLHSQASGNSNEGSSGSDANRRKVMMPPAPPGVHGMPKPPSASASPRLDDLPPHIVGSRNSFRLNVGPNFPVEEFFVDHL